MSELSSKCLVGLGDTKGGLPGGNKRRISLKIVGASKPACVERMVLTRNSPCRSDELKMAMLTEDMTGSLLDSMKSMFGMS